MPQSYKVFINNRFILFTYSMKKSGNSTFFKKSNTIIYRYQKLMELLIDTNYSINYDIIFICNNPLKLFTRFQSNFIFVNAAGGIVKNNQSQLLMIYKRNIWDLPKGKIDNYESTSEAALREVYEETNASDLTVLPFSWVTYHIYIEKRVKTKPYVFFKETTWFLMHASSYMCLLPQIHESITDVKWMSIGDIIELKTYKSISCLLASVIKVL